MNWIEALVLGIVQGLTEFLPVSSSGHLVLFQKMFGLAQPELLFDICLHVGTLLAVLIVFYKDLAALLTALAKLPKLARSSGGPMMLLSRHAEFRMMVMIVVGIVPTAVLGLVFTRMAEALFGTVWLVGLTLLCTGTFLWFTRRCTTQGRSITGMRLRDAFIIGLVQGLAIVPGISRSGATISAALYLGIDRELAGRFSFLMAIPAIMGALVLGLDVERFNTSMPAGIILAGSLCAALVGYLALRMLLGIVKKGQLHHFAPYCWVVGALALMASLM